MAKRAQGIPSEARLPKALSHPLRAQALTILNERVASPSEIAETLGAGLEHVGYHLRVLRDLGCIELVDTVRRRGFTEHYYRAVERPYLTDREWKHLSRVAVKFNDGGTLQGNVQRDGTVSVDAPTPGVD
jgi:DNA-binding transcriptional ArsR family regulator